MIRKKHEETEKHFQIGIAMAARGGFIQDAIHFFWIEMNA